MTTTELTSRIIETLIAEIPIHMDGDEQGIREEMSALIHGHVERYRQQMYDRITEEVARQLRIFENVYWLRHSICDDILNRVKEILLN